MGCGGRGSYDASIAHADPRATVMALCDRFPDQYDKSETTIKSQNTRKYSDYEKLLAAPDIDAVFIVTPPFEHPRMLETAMQAKKHIYLEKPIGVDVPGVKRAMEAAKKADKTKDIAVGFQQRYGPVYLEGYKRLQAGAIGELANARGAWIANDPFTRRPFSDPAVEKIRNWFCYKESPATSSSSRTATSLTTCTGSSAACPPRPSGAATRRSARTWTSSTTSRVIYAWPKEMFVNFEANQLTPRGFSKIGEEFTGTKGTIFTSRDKMTHYIAQGKQEDMVSKRDITIDSIEAFITRIVENKPENAVAPFGVEHLHRAARPHGGVHGSRSHLEGRHRDPDRLGVNLMHKHTAAALAAAVLLPLALSAQMRAGAAKRTITPDLEKHGPVYMAGFGNNRKATGVHDDLYARCVALSAGGRPLAICAVDLIGVFWDDVRKIRAKVEGADVIVASLHDHEGPDTMGQWGPSQAQSGINEAYMSFLVDRVAEAAQEAVKSMRARAAPRRQDQARRARHLHRRRPSADRPRRRGHRAPRRDRRRAADRDAHQLGQPSRDPRVEEHADHVRLLGLSS